MNLFGIDTATMILVLISGQLFSGILVFAYTSQHERSKALNTFLLSKLLQPTAWILISVRDLTLRMLLIAIANVLLFFGAVLELIALVMLKDGFTPKFRKIYLSVLAGCILVYSAAAAYGISENVRITFASALTAFLIAFPVYLLFSDKQASILQKIIVASYSITILLLLFRAVTAVTTDLNMDLNSTSIFNTWMFVMQYLDMIAGSMGFILLNKEKLDAELVRAASIDGLTNTLNRQTFEKRSAEMIFLFARRP